MPRGPGTELRTTVRVPRATLASLARLLMTAGRKGRRHLAECSAGGKQNKTIMEPRPEDRMEGNSWDLKNEDCRNWFGLVTGSVPAESLLSSLNNREDVWGAPVGAKTFCQISSLPALSEHNGK